jgi:ATP-dependent exoDNAse (exonuclease V) alpha subunit
MAIFSMRVQIITRGKGRSVIAAAAYRAGEKLRDERQGMTHDFSWRTDVEHAEILLPDDAPEWVKGLGREALFNAIDAAEVRRDAQTAREVRLAIPREVAPEDRRRLVLDFVRANFVTRGMIADVAFHNDISPTDGKEQPHAHVLLSTRPLTATGFGLKSRHDRIPDPSGRTHADGRPVMIDSNLNSWNRTEFYESCRAAWENAANEALAAAGSAARIDRRSYLERGLSRLPEPALRLAFHLKELRGALKTRMGQWHSAKFYKAVEDRAKTALERKNGSSVTAEFMKTTQRVHDWIERQISRMSDAWEVPQVGPDAPLDWER